MGNKPKNQLNIYKEFWKLANTANDIANTGRYDVDMLIESLKHLFSQTLYFYRDLTNKTGDPKNTYYSLKAEPTEHQLILCQLGRGYSKELYDNHWCYVFKHCGSKFFVIPTTSVKQTSRINLFNNEFDLEEDDGTFARMHFDEMRMVDKMRVINTQYINVKTSRKDIQKALANYLGFTLADETVDKSKL